MDGKLSDGTPDLDSSQQVLKPNKYLQTRGLDVQFGGSPSSSTGRESTRPDSYGDVIDKMIDTIFTTPLLFSENPQKERYAVPVSARQEFNNDVQPAPSNLSSQSTSKPKPKNPQQARSGKDTASTDGGKGKDVRFEDL